MKKRAWWSSRCYAVSKSRWTKALIHDWERCDRTWCVTAGCRFMAAYPITPASEIMEYLIKKLPKLGGTVIQTEDEIAGATMAIGANYAGVRTITASAGPGLSLNMESIGLAGMTETPIVIVDTQRGGPSTGMATKQEQSDLMSMIYGTHGEIPKIVMRHTLEEDSMIQQKLLISQKNISVRLFFIRLAAFIRQANSTAT